MASHQSLSAQLMALVERYISGSETEKEICDKIRKNVDTILQWLKTVTIKVYSDSFQNVKV